MGAGHAHPLYLEGASPVHRLPPEVKIVAAFLAGTCVVATPREAFGVFGGYLLLAAVWVLARSPPRWILSRSLIEAPFVVLAVLLPFVGEGERMRLARIARGHDPRFLRSYERGESGCTSRCCPGAGPGRCRCSRTLGAARVSGRPGWPPPRWHWHWR